MSLEITKCLGEVPLLLPLGPRNYSDLPGLQDPLPAALGGRPAEGSWEPGLPGLHGRFVL
jgi:hypothetical protein